jgi:DNA-binding NarL/FixJ family response regulator
MGGPDMSNLNSFRTPPAVPETALTARESEILDLLTEGLSNKEIGARKNLAAGTVRNHLAKIFRKLHVRCRTEAATKCIRAKAGGTSAE